MVYQDRLPDQLILRDELALDRTRLANERTLLAYFRTAIMLLISGGTVLKVFEPTVVNVVSAWSLVGVGLTVAVTGVMRFLALRCSLSKILGLK